MRLLIDECIDERLRLLFPGHEVETARYANLAGLKTGGCSRLPRKPTVFAIWRYWYPRRYPR
jgi:hypothetical protein